MFHHITHHVSRLTFLKVIIIILLYGHLTTAGVAFAQAPITAQVDRTTLSTDEQLWLTVTVTGDFVNIPTPSLSHLADFVVVSSSTSTRFSVINGNMTAQGIFRFRLQPLQEGSLVIPPIGITIDRQLYQTEPIDIEVIPGRTPTPSPDEDPSPADGPNPLQGQDLFVEAEVDNLTPYLGQQIVYTFRFYQAVEFQTGLRDQLDYEPPPFTDFWSETILSQPQYTTTAAGRGYIVTEVRTALFPASLGSTTIGPTMLHVPGGLFNPDVVLETEPITIDVQPLPEGAPADFNGAVGQFQVRTQVSATEGKVNEPLALIVEVEGAGNIEVLTEPYLPELPDWRIFDGQASTILETQGDVVYGTRRFERLITPRKPGDHTFPPIRFSYYDPQAEAYRTVNSDPIPIAIQPGDTEPLSAITLGSDKQPIELMSGDIRHIKPVPPSLMIATTSLLTSPLYWTFWILPTLAVGGIWVWRMRRQRLLADAGYIRRQRARRTAHRILAETNRSGTDGYAAAHRALLGYLSDKLNQPTAGLTTENLSDLLDQHQFDAILIKRVRATLDQIEIGRFAPIEEAEAQSLISETRRLINALEKSWGSRR